jgi:hypothetical protein
MTRLQSTCLVLAVLTLSSAPLGCGKKDADPDTIPVGSGAPTAVAAETPDAGTAAAVADAAAPTPAQPVNPNPNPKPAAGGGGNIDGCCTGIAAVKKSGKDAASKNKASAAAMACPGISKAVKDGKTSRADAMTQIKALLGGVHVPECG